MGNDNTSTFSLPECYVESCKHGSADRNTTLQAILRKSERHVQNAKDAICNVSNPLDVDEKDQLLILLGAAAPANVEDDVLITETLGEKAWDISLHCRQQGEEYFFNPVKTLNLMWKPRTKW